jgi:HD-GYP domain-containing protein (c-di-GMP phosphodiesterase class II)
MKGTMSSMLKSLKVPITDLELGMFVSALDRPWLGTPFFTQGFVIEDRAQIDRLREYCEYVVIDTRRSHKLASAPLQKTRKNLPQVEKDHKLHERPRVPVEKIFAGRSIKAYKDDSNWEDEHPRAKAALDTLVDDINVIFEEVIDGGKIDVIKLRKSVDPIIESISRNPDACLWVARLKQHDKYTYQHSLGASIWSVSLGRQLGLPKHDLRSLAMGCMLMDVGKLRVDTDLLQANRSLTEQEMDEMRDHVRYGLEIIEESGVINQDVIDMVAYHHERFNGSGYPNGLRSDDIPAFARIAAIVDTYDAITSNRSHAPARSPSDAIKLLYNSRDADFQAELVEAFIQAVGIYPAGTLVELSSGEVGVVVAEYRTRRLRPKVMVLLDADKQRLKTPKFIDLHDESADEAVQSLSISKSLEPGAYDLDLSAVAV